jgi:hypothetical protein
MAFHPVYRAFAFLLPFTISGIATAQDNPAGDRPPISGDAARTRAEPGRNGEVTPRKPDATGTTDVSPGVGTVEGADGKPPIPNRAGK